MQTRRRKNSELLHLSLGKPTSTGAARRMRTRVCGGSWALQANATLNRAQLRCAAVLPATAAAAARRHCRSLLFATDGSTSAFREFARAATSAAATNRLLPPHPRPLYFATARQGQGHCTLAKMYHFGLKYAKMKVEK